MLAGRIEPANCPPQRNIKSRVLAAYVQDLTVQWAAGVSALFVQHQLALGHVRLVTGWVVLLALALMVFWTIAFGTPKGAWFVGMLLATSTRSGIH